MLRGELSGQGGAGAQPLYRPTMPQAGHEYWPFDGEYGPTNRYYKYTIKNACAKKKED